MNIENYYSALYDEGESVCFAWRTNDWSVTSLSKWQDQRSPWISVNPLFPDRDNDPESSLLSTAQATRGRRADCNVIILRNILIEMDTISAKEQWEAIRECEMPFTTSTFSGGKSIHFVISLSDPCNDRTAYDELVALVHLAIPVVVDTKCKNPSRLTRNPGAVNPKHKREQKLIEVRGRVTQSEIKSWAASRGILPVQKRPVIQYSFKQLPQWAERILSEGVQEGERNDTMFRLSCIMAKSGLQMHETISRWQSVPGFGGLKISEIETTVKSAYRKAGN